MGLGMGMMSMGSKETAVWTAAGRQTGLPRRLRVDMDVVIAWWSKGPKMPDHLGTEGAIRLSSSPRQIFHSGSLAQSQLHDAVPT